MFFKLSLYLKLRHLDEQQYAEIEKKVKTESIVFSSKQHVKKTENLHIKVRSGYINLSISLRNLEFISISYVKPLIIK